MIAGAQKNVSNKHRGTEILKLMSAALIRGNKVSQMITQYSSGYYSTLEFHHFQFTF